MKRDCKPYRVWVRGEPRDLEARSKAEAKRLASIATGGLPVERVELLADEWRDYHVTMRPHELPPPKERTSAKSTVEALRIVNAQILLAVPEFEGVVRAVDAQPIL